MPKIYITCFWLNGAKDWVGGALAEDGTGLRQHLSTSKIWVRHDMGLTSKKGHEEYSKYYPNGFELVDLVDATDEELSSNQGYLDALAANELGDDILGQSLHDEGGPTNA